MSAPSPGYSITVRADAPAAIDTTGAIAAAVAAAGGALTALDVVESHGDKLVVDVTCNASDADHADRITAEIAGVEGVTVRKVSDRTFLLHLGGKLEVVPKVPLKHRDDLSRAYTPGVARVCLAIAENPEDARRLTIKRNTVAVVTDGSAVLGLGNIGPAAALPVMEGKAALFKQFAGVDAWPVCLDTQDTEQIIMIVKAMAPVYGGINLEDISAPRCFEIEARLRDELDIPVFHDDQHGTAIVTLAALRNALRVVGKELEDVRIVVSGVGAAGHAIVRLLDAQGAADIIGCDRRGALDPEAEHADEFRGWIARNTNPSRTTGTLKEVLRGADVFIGVSAPNLLDGHDIATMAERAIVFAMANPDPEVDPVAASHHAAVVATGRSDYANQINNVLAFPGFFRGLLDAGASDITDEMMIAAAAAIADCVHPDELNASYIVPSVFDAEVAPAVAAAVRQAAGGRHVDPTARHTVSATRETTHDPYDECGARPMTLDLAALGATLDARLRDADAALAQGFPGERPVRQPVHTVYVPADRYDAGLVSRWRAEAIAALDLHGGGAEGAADAFGLPAALASDLYGRVRDKLQREAIEDLRIDFEDGYGTRADDEEDAAVDAAAAALLRAVDAGEATAFNGIRFKSFEAPTRQRGLRTFVRFVEAVARDGRLPDGFVVTFPKVTSVDQVEAMVLACEQVEQGVGLAEGAIRFEIQVETPQAIGGPDGTALVARMVHASSGRCTSLHYGTYDYSASCGIAAAYQSMEHPAADHAKAVMQVAAAGTGVHLSDGSTNVLPVGDHDAVVSAWRLHGRLVRRSLERGYYQGWDLHPAQLPSRFLATYAFYREGLPAAGQRLRNYVGQVDSGVMDEPATARALSDFVVRALDCGATDEQEVHGLTGLDRLAIDRLARRSPA